MQNEFYNIPSKMPNEAKLNELLENQRELVKIQQLNNLLLLSQDPNTDVTLRKVAKTDALALLSGIKLVSDDLREMSVRDWYRIKKSVEIHNNGNEKDSVLAK